MIELTERLAKLENDRIPNKPHAETQENAQSIQVQIPKELIKQGYTIMLQREPPKPPTAVESKQETLQKAPTASPPEPPKQNELPEQNRAENTNIASHSVTNLFIFSY